MGCASEMGDLKRDPALPPLLLVLAHVARRRGVWLIMSCVMLPSVRYARRGSAGVGGANPADSLLARPAWPGLRTTSVCQSSAVYFGSVAVFLREFLHSFFFLFWLLWAVGTLSSRCMSALSTTENPSLGSARRTCRLVRARNSYRAILTKNGLNMYVLIFFFFFWGLSGVYPAGERGPLWLAATSLA